MFKLYLQNINKNTCMQKIYQFTFEDKSLLKHDKLRGKLPNKARYDTLDNSFLAKTII